MRFSAAFIGRWAANFSLAAIAIASSVKPEDAMSNLAGWTEYLHLPTPAWLQSPQADKIGFYGSIVALISLGLGYYFGKKGEKSPEKVVASSLDGDIDARKAFFQILESSKWKSEQEARTTNTKQLVRNWLEVRLRTEIHKALRNSRLASWGEECLQGTATTPEKPIPADAWDIVEINFDRTTLPRTAAHFKGRTSFELGRMAWVGVCFSSAQIFQMFPLDSQVNEWRPMFEAVAHVANKIGDNNAAKCFPDTCKALRQAALDKEITIRGKISAASMGAGSGYSAVETDIPATYWEGADIGPMATDKQALEIPPHTFPHQFSNGQYGDSNIHLYAALRIKWNEILKKWPS